MGLVPALVFFAWYNATRFGSPLESGYSLAVVPEFLLKLRDQGLFSPAHIPMNLEYLFLELPKLIGRSRSTSPTAWGCRC